MKVKLITDGLYAFGAEYIGQVLPAIPNGAGGYTVTFPIPVGTLGNEKVTWFYMSHEVEVVDG